jgi:hypothetical protein
MTTLESFVDHIWKQVGPACREHLRESWEIISRADPELQVKLLVCFYWANWCRGRNDQASGRDTFWEME